MVFIIMKNGRVVETVDELDTANEKYLGMTIVEEPELTIEDVFQRIARPILFQKRVNEHRKSNNITIDDACLRISNQCCVLPAITSYDYESFINLVKGDVILESLFDELKEKDLFFSKKDFYDWEEYVITLISMCSERDELIAVNKQVIQESINWRKWIESSSLEVINKLSGFNKKEES